MDTYWNGDIFKTLLSAESKNEESQTFYFLIHKAGIDPEGCVPIDDSTSGTWMVATD